MPGPSNEAVQRVLENHASQPVSQVQAGADQGWGILDAVSGLFDGAEVLLEAPELIGSVVEGAGAVLGSVGELAGPAMEAVGAIGEAALGVVGGIGEILGGLG